MIEPIKNVNITKNNASSFAVKSNKSVFNSSLPAKKLDISTECIPLPKPAYKINYLA